LSYFVVLTLLFTDTAGLPVRQLFSAGDLVE
jgi:hypothetical protein